LTPTGIKNITEHTYRYVIASYKLIKDVEAKVDLLFDGENTKEVVLLGKKDGILVLLEDKLKQKGVRYIYTDSVEEISEGSLVLLWQPEYVDEISDDKDVEFVNLLSEM